jgi:DNA-binding protein H-NS
MARSYEALMAQIAALQDKANAMRQREADGVIKRIREAIAVYSITAADLYAADGVSLKKVKAVAKQKPAKKVVSKRAQAVHSKSRKEKVHRGPLAGVPKAVKYSDENGNKWSGGGSTPRWLREAVQAGHDKEEFRVKAA